MEKINKKLTIIKYGSNTLVKNDENGNVSVDYINIKKHGLIIDKIKNPVIIVSSGAVAFGKTLGNEFDYIKDDIVRKRIFSALGNPHLSIGWDNAIPNKSVLQSLITHRDLISETSKEKILDIVSALFGNKNNDAVIQVNDNDFITDEELVKIRGGDFGDNDKTAQLLSMLCTQVFEKVEVIFNTSSDGVTENGKTVESIKLSVLTDSYIDGICNKNETSLGTGGMGNKLKIIRDIIKKENTIAYIINGKKPNQLEDILKNKGLNTKIYNDS